MAIRKVYAPYSTTGEQVGQTPVEGYVDVKQEIQPTILTGELGKDGEWSGVIVSDKNFTIDAEHLEIANGAAVLSPQKSNHEYIDMTGFNDLFVAFKVSNGGNFAITAVMGPDTYPYANLSPVNPATFLRGNAAQASPDDFENIFQEGAQSMTANVWNIFSINGILSNWKLLQFQITNNSGGNSDIQFASLRVV
tara:strand:- start:912 stop:1493 length:582 start_codon:yes stop_codon:yes gene_type:complete